jgi:hypothetical protein
MTSRTWLTALALMVVVAAPAGAADQQRRKTRDNGDQPRQTERAPEKAAGRERAVPRTVEPRRDEQAQRADQNRRVEQDRRVEQSQRAEVVSRPTDNRRYDNNRSYDNRGYSNRGYDNRGYDNRRYSARIIRPSIIRVAPYRPYVYRPSYSIGVYYGSGGYYPYGETPRGYYDPIPGRYYGGVRITGAPRDAQVFADGYFVGLVDDFDGIFQHVNLEAGPHHLEIRWGNYEPVAFDVYVRPGDTTTFRGDGYFGQY